MFADSGPITPYHRPSERVGIRPSGGSGLGPKNGEPDNVKISIGDLCFAGISGLLRPAKGPILLRNPTTFFAFARIDMFNTWHFVAENHGRPLSSHSLS